MALYPGLKRSGTRGLEKMAIVGEWKLNEAPDRFNRGQAPGNRAAIPGKVIEEIREKGE